MLTGENGIIKQASDAKDETEQAKVEELVTLAVNGLIAENQGDRSKITPNMIAQQVNEMEKRTDVTAENSTFPTNILFPKEDREVGVNIDLAVTDPIEQEIYSEPVEESQIAPDDLFDYEIISNAEEGAIELDSLPTKTARITRIKPQYCNDNGYNPETSQKNFIDTNYEIVYDGETISDTLVVPYQVEIEGEMYKITEVNLFAMGSDGYIGYSFPRVKTVIYPNTVKKIYGKAFAGGGETYNDTLEIVILPNCLMEIENYAFYRCRSLNEIIIPNSIMNIRKEAFRGCSNLTNITIPENVISIEEYAFCGAGLTNITIANGVTSIGKYAFSGCTDLTSITIPESVMTIIVYWKSLLCL